MIASARALLALALLAGLYLMAFLMVLVWLAVAALGVELFATRVPDAPHFNITGILLTVGSGVALFRLLAEVRQVSLPAGADPDSILVDERRSPQLWRLVRRLADQVGTAAPAEIRLTAEVNAAVTDDSRWLGLRSGYRRLYLGAPLLVGLSADELRAVLAHELGHYARRHARFTEPAYRVSVALAEARQRIREAMSDNGVVRMYAGPVLGTIGFYAGVSNRLTLPIRRHQEIEADRISAQIAGPRVLARALLASAELAASWDGFQHEFAEPFRKATGCVPDNPYPAFGCMLADPDWQAALADIGLRATEQPSRRGDSHPSLATRLELLATNTGEPGEPGEPWPAPDVPDGLLAKAAPFPVRLSRSDKRPWRDWLTALAEHRATAPLAPLAAAALAVTGSRPSAEPAAPSLETVLHLLDAHRATDLAHAVDPGQPRTEDNDRRARQRLVALISALVGHGLVGAGSAQWVMGWAGPSRLVAANTTAEQIELWVATAVDDPGQVSWLRTQLASLHLDAAALPIPAVTARPAGRRASSGAGGRPATVTISSREARQEVQRRWRAENAPVAIGILAVLLASAFMVWFMHGAPADEPGGGPIIQPRYPYSPAPNLIPNPIFSYPFPDGTNYPIPIPAVHYPVPTDLFPTNFPLPTR